jgi:hypothetical protein
MGLRRSCTDSVLVEYEQGYIFTPFGAYGRASLISRSTSAPIVKALTLFCVSVWPVVGLVAATGLYGRIAHLYWPFAAAVTIGLLWMVGFWIWAKLATRGLIEVERNAL